MGGLNVTASFTNVAFLLVGLVVGVPILLVIFGETGPFNNLVALPGQGELASNSYSGILLAIITLIPLLIVAYFAMKFVSGSGIGGKMMGGGKKGGGGKTTRRGKRARASGASRRVNYRNPSAADVTRAQKVLAAVQARQGGGGGPPVV